MSISTEKSGPELQCPVRPAKLWKTEGETPTIMRTEAIAGLM